MKPIHPELKQIVDRYSEAKKNFDDCINRSSEYSSLGESFRKRVPSAIRLLLGSSLNKLELSRNYPILFGAHFNAIVSTLELSNKLTELMQSFRKENTAEEIKHIDFLYNQFDHLSNTFSAKHLKNAEEVRKHIVLIEQTAGELQLAVSQSGQRYMEMDSLLQEIEKVGNAENN